MKSSLAWFGSSTRYRLHLLLGVIGSLVILGIVPMFGNMLAQSSLSPLAGVDHIGSLCLIALHFLLRPVHYVLQAMLAGGLVYAIRDRYLAWTAMRQVLHALPARIPGPESHFSIAANRAGLTRGQIRIVHDLVNPAFTVGFLRPRVYLSGSLVAHLTLDELIAVMKHEAVHVQRRDPLRLSVLRFFACLLFWIPALRRLIDDVADESELEADRRAAGNSPLVLASALLVLAQWNVPDLPASAPAVGFSRQDILNRRIRVLAGERVSVRSRLSRGLAMAAMMAVATTWVVGVAVAHPMPSAVPHAAHSLRANWECLYSRVTATEQMCVHRHAIAGFHRH